MHAPFTSILFLVQRRTDDQLRPDDRQRYQVTKWTFMIDPPTQVVVFLFQQHKIKAVSSIGHRIRDKIPRQNS